MLILKWFIFARVWKQQALVFMFQTWRLLLNRRFQCYSQNYNLWQQSNYHDIYGFRFPSNIWVYVLLDIVILRKTLKLLFKTDNYVIYLPQSTICVQLSSKCGWGFNNMCNCNFWEILSILLLLYHFSIKNFSIPPKNLRLNSNW